MCWDWSAQFRAYHICLYPHPSCLLCSAQQGDVPVSGTTVPVLSEQPVPDSLLRAVPASVQLLPLALAGPPSSAYPVSVRRQCPASVPGGTVVEPLVQYAQPWSQGGPVCGPTWVPYYLHASDIGKGTVCGTTRISSPINFVEWVCSSFDSCLKDGFVGMCILLCQ